MTKTKLKDVDSYIAGSDKEVRPKLEEFRKIIKSTVPKVEEGMIYDVPFYKYHGALAGFAAYENYISFGFAAVIQKEYREMLKKKGYKTGNKTIRIETDQEVPTTTIKQILKAQAKMNEDKK